MERTSKKHTIQNTTTQISKDAKLATKKGEYKKLIVRIRLKICVRKWGTKLMCANVR